MSIKQKIRLDNCVEYLLKKQQCYFWTFTTVDVVDYRTIADRWRKLRNYLNVKYDGFLYVQNFEIHPKGHGWHIHMLCNVFLNLRDKRLFALIKRYGFGRINVERVKTKSVSDYFSKHAIKAYRYHRTLEGKSKRYRLVNVSKKFQFPLKDYQWQSPKLEKQKIIIKELRNHYKKNKYRYIFHLADILSSYGYNSKVEMVKKIFQKSEKKCLTSLFDYDIMQVDKLNDA